MAFQRYPTAVPWGPERRAQLLGLARFRNHPTLICDRISLEGQAATLQRNPDVGESGGGGEGLARGKDLQVEVALGPADQPRPPEQFQAAQTSGPEQLG